jgi:hypothetical protein
MMIYKSLLQKLWRGCDPYVGFPYRTVKPDLQGWQSQHRAHDLEAARGDINRWWKALRDGGIMIVDDYDKDGRCWPGTYAAVNEFLDQTRIQDFESEDLKCRFLKPSEA